MKRIVVLLMVLTALAWIGSRLAPHSKPAPGIAQTAATVAPPKPSLESEASHPNPKRSISMGEKKAQQERWFGTQTIVAAERAVRKELKDPGSAQFKDVLANYTEEFGMVACGQVNARNEFGGYTGFRRFVSGGKSVILEGRDNISGAWAGACHR